MPIQATVILDSGCFLPMPEDNKGEYTEIGYFGSNKRVSDIRVLTDGIENNLSGQFNIGKKSKIEVRHVNADGEVKRDGVKPAPNFHDQLLHMEDLYGKRKHKSVNRKKFDCIIRFESGLFCGSLIKTRHFEEYRKQRNGKYAHTKGCKRKLVSKPVAHNVLVHFCLEDGDALEIVKNGEVAWSSRDSGATGRLEVEIIADNDTAEKFFRMALKDKMDSYWLPNIGDPPPICPEPPCQP